MKILNEVSQEENVESQLKRSILPLLEWGQPGDNEKNTSHFCDGVQKWMIVLTKCIREIKIT